MQQLNSWPSFVIGPSNRFAAAAAQAVVAMPRAYNPLWLHGPTGCGKTHLLNTIASGLPSDVAPSRLIDGPALIDEFCTAVRAGQPRAWQESLAAHSTILVDDLDALDSLPELQRALGRALSELAAREVQVILASKRRPRALAELAEALTGNEWHLEAPLNPCDDEIMMSLIRRWLANLAIAVAPGNERAEDVVARALLSAGSRDIGALHGWLLRIEVAARWWGERVSARLIAEVV